ncbi:LysR family transcriptional regulator [Methanobrevibacter wolinii]|uniref:LysR family transcriptional regulator n=1 Tax=Methanobrevibacter wolinii TaxID=190977 RepID=UPI0005B2D19C|nr:LysR family transcriptional regulator [Methanobrevibacter wolinii]
MDIKPLLNIEINGKIYNYKLFQSLDVLSKTYSQRKSAKKLGISHSVFNRRILKAEKDLGYKLVNKIGSGSELTNEALNLLDLYHTYNNRLKKSDNIRIAGGHIITGLIESLDLPFNLEVFSTDTDSAFSLAEDDLIDILALDDPLIALSNDLDFTPIAFDYMVLVSNNKNNIRINSIKDLSNLNFVPVKGSAQRLVWDTLKTNNIPFNLEKEVKSQFDAFKLVKNSDNLYTFLNGSYFKGNNVLKNQTIHSLGFVYSHGVNPEVDKFVDYISNNCSDLIKLQGFSSF